MVVLCADLATPDRGLALGLDLDVVATTLVSVVPDVRVDVVEGLCRHPSRLFEIDDGFDDGQGVVAGVCVTPATTQDFVPPAGPRRRGPAPSHPTGSHPLASSPRVDVTSLAIVRAGTSEGAGTEHAVALLAGAAARVRAGQAAGPYVAPAVRVGATPGGAARVGGAAPRRTDRRSLLSLGLLSSDQAVWTGSGEVECQVTQMLAARPDTGRVLLACQPAAPVLDRVLLSMTTGPVTADWLPVVVPCLSLITPGWILQILAAGSHGVALLACADCRDHPESGMHEALRFARRCLLTLDVDDSERAVTELPSDPAGLACALGAPAPPRAAARAQRPALCLHEPEATATAALSLDRTCEDVPAALVDAASPIGTLRVRADQCTMCGACVRACETGALSLQPLQPDEDQAQAQVAALTYAPDHCSPCGACVSVCPEHALSLRPALDLAVLRAGVVPLAQATSARCRRCGGVLAPDPLLEQVRRRLSGPADPGQSAPTDLCAACAQVMAVAAFG